MNSLNSHSNSDVSPPRDAASSDPRTEWFDRISHDVLSPLASMRDAIAILLEGIPGPLTEKQHRLLSLNRRCAGNLSRMIQNLLLELQADAGDLRFRMRLEHVDALVDRAVREYATESGEAGVEIQRIPAAARIEVPCDPNLIRVAFDNLIDNAVKFSPAGAVVDVRTDLLHVRPGDEWPSHLLFQDVAYVVISVSDTGPGIHPAEKESIFLGRHGSTPNPAGALHRNGPGLGLSVVRRVAETHSGGAWVEDNVNGNGSTFRVAIPNVRGHESAIAGDS